MRRPGLLLCAGAGAMLLLAAWVSAAGPVGIFVKQDFSAVGSKAPGEEYSTDPQVAQRDVRGSGGPVSHSFLVDLLDWVMTLLVAVVVLAVLVVVARALLERWRSRTRPTPDSVDAEVLPETLLAGAQASQELLAHGTPANAVIAAWVALEDAVRSTGLPDDDARTAGELVTSVLRRLAVRREPLDRLAELYREARFSRHPVHEPMRAAAQAELRLIQEDLRAAVERRRRAALEASR